MELLPIVDEYLKPLWLNYRAALTCSTLAIILVGIYAYFFLRTVTIHDEVAVPMHWEMWGSILRIVDYFIGTSKNQQEASGIVRQTARIPSNVVFSQGNEICYTDLLNPFKYLTPRVQPAALLRMS